MATAPRIYDPREDLRALRPARQSRLVSMHPLARVTLYVILYWYVNSTAIDFIWRVANP